MRITFIDGNLLGISTPMQIETTKTVGGNLAAMTQFLVAAAPRQRKTSNNILILIRAK
jgi:hypothetical protein